MCLCFTGTDDIMRTRGDEVINAEFSFVDFGDRRLNQRLVQVGIDFVDAPGASIPKLCGDWAKAKAAYRFFNNPNVTREQILQSHRERANQRIDVLDEVLFISDTTFFTFPHHPSKSGLGDVGDSDTDVEGVLVHSTIAVSPRSGMMKGVYDQQVIIRQQEGETIFWRGDGEHEVVENEGRKWEKGVEAGLERVPSGVRPRFVFDRGGDSYDVLSRIKGGEAGFVIRSNQNRVMRSPEGERSRLHEWIRGKQNIGEMERQIYREGKGKVDVDFEVQAGKCEVLAPHPRREKMEDEGAVGVNVVRVVEKEGGEEPIEWILMTDRDLQGMEDAREVIDLYEHRWKIEEWHECLKQRGADFEKRQLEEWERMDRLLGVISVVSWRLLGLRDLAREQEDRDAQECLTEAEMRVIEHMDEEVEEGDTAEEYLLGVARIGGYMDRSNDPPPGWQILWRGFSDVQKMAKGYRMAQQ